MKNIYVLLVAFFLLSLTGRVGAQSSEVEHYRVLTSTGVFPEDFKQVLSQKNQSEDDNSFMNEMIKGGRLLYGTPLNDYVERVADNLLRNDPALREKLRFYIVKSPVVNAYALKNGIILVNEGLLAQVSNEAELAFVIGHEIAHYAEQHSVQIGKYAYKGNGSDQMQYYLGYRSRTREQEAAADRIAVERYIAASSYSFKALDGVFDVMQYGDLPFDEIPFDRTQVETSFYHFPDNYFLNKVTPIANRSETIDTLYSHPNIEKRRSLIKLLVSNKSDEGRTLFVQPQETFGNIRNLARMECIYYWLGVHQYDQALYNVYVMQRSLPDNAFLDRAMVMAYYGMFVHKREGSVNEVIYPYKKVEGEMQQMSYFLSQLSRFELSLLSLRQAWKAHEKYPAETCYSDLIKENMREIFVVSKKKYTDFSDYPMGYTADSAVTMTESRSSQADYAQAGSKYDKIRQGSQSYEMVLPTARFRTANYMLVDIHRDSDFVVMMNEVILEEDNKQILNAISTKTEKVSSLLLMEPYCEVKTKTYRAENEKKAVRIQQQLSHALVKSAKRLKMKPLYFDVNTIKNFDTKQYNDYTTLRQWYREYRFAGGAQMKYLASEEVKRITKELDCNKLCLVAVCREPGRFATGGKIVDLILSVTCPYVVPFAVANFAMPCYKTRVDMMIVDIATGKQERVGSQSYSGPISQAYRNAAVYDELYKYVKGK
ncbi:MAG: M48 family metallopeptidase [Bacteroidales bacterium]|nr:M48 family metallopeptidase [Bacteroidales bacterium]